jgi:dihydroneopterin aldolase
LVAERVVAHIQARQYQLIEAVAESTAELILQGFKVQGCGVTVSKPGALPAAQAVGVHIWRGVAL